MSSTSRAGAAILALYQLARTTLAEDDTVQVVLGPTLTGDRGDSVHIGYDGNPDGDYLATESVTQTYAGLGAKARDEEFDVRGAVIVTNGDKDSAAAVARVFALLGELEIAVKANPSLGQLSPFVAGIVPGELELPLSGSVGLQATLPFVLRVSTRVLPNT